MSCRRASCRTRFEVAGCQRYVLSLRTAYWSAAGVKTGYFHELFRLVEDVA
jgi:hypothetical protein